MKGPQWRSIPTSPSVARASARAFGEDHGWGSIVEESHQIFEWFIALGGNFIDTANGYTTGHSEKIIGDHVGRDAAKRKHFVIATKFSSNLFPGDPTVRHGNDHDHRS